VSQGLSVRAIESEIQEILRAYEAEEISGSSTAAIHDQQATGTTTPKRKGGRPASRRSSQIVSLENELRRAVGTKVVIHANSKGAGRIVIPFGSPEEFERLLEFLKN